MRAFHLPVEEQLDEALAGGPHGLVRTATRVANSANWRFLAALSEYEVAFLNGPNRSVNRKVQGSNPCSGATHTCSGATFEFGMIFLRAVVTRLTTTALQSHNNKARSTAR